MRKLVELDPVSMRTKEFDTAKIRRSALELKDYLLKLPHAENIFRLRERVLPIVESAIAGSLGLPLDGRDIPLAYERTDGLLPPEYSRVSAPFFVAITGLSGLGTKLLEPIHKDGKVFAWMEFEDSNSCINSRGAT